MPFSNDKFIFMNYFYNIFWITKTLRSIPLDFSAIYGEILKAPAPIFLFIHTLTYISPQKLKTNLWGSYFSLFLSLFLFCRIKKERGCMFSVEIKSFFYQCSQTLKNSFKSVPLHFHPIGGGSEKKKEEQFTFLMDVSCSQSHL